MEKTRNSGVPGKSTLIPKEPSSAFWERVGSPQGHQRIGWKPRLLLYTKSLRTWGGRVRLRAGGAGSRSCVMSSL